MLSIVHFVMPAQMVLSSRDYHLQKSMLHQPYLHPVVPSRESSTTLQKQIELILKDVRVTRYKSQWND